MKCITLWQPWATWIGWGWKTIETRTHERFACLVGRRIAIHAGLKWDKEALEIASPWINGLQYRDSGSYGHAHGAVVATAFAQKHSKLSAEHSRAAMIDCKHTDRQGLFLSDINWLSKPIPAKGKQGIWNIDLPADVQ